MPVGVETTYGQTAGIKLDIEDGIYTLTATDVPLLGTYNGTNTPAGPGRSIFARELVSAKKIEWLEEDLLVARSDLSAAYTAGGTTVAVTAGDGLKFQEGMVIRIDEELMRITAVATDTLTVTTAFGGTTNASHASGADVIGVGTSLPEGSDPKEARWKDRGGLYNLTEIFGPYKIQVSGTEEVVAKYGVSSEFDHQAANRTREIMVEIEQAALYGRRFEDTTNKWRTMGGLYYFITSNVNTTTTDITEAALIDQQVNAYNAGGSVDTLIVGAKQKRKLSALNAGVIRIDRSDRVRGQVVDVFESDFGSLDIVLDRWVRDTDMFGVSREYVNWAVLRPLMVEQLAKTGDSWAAQILCEYSMKVRMEKRHFRFTGLTAA